MSEDDTWNSFTPEMSARLTKPVNFNMKKPKVVSIPEIEEVLKTVSLAQKEAVALITRYNVAVELLKQIDKSLYIGEDLKDKEIMEHYTEVVKIIKEQIKEFLNDKAR